MATPSGIQVELARYIDLFRYLSILRPFCRNAICNLKTTISIYYKSSLHYQCQINYTLNVALYIKVYTSINNTEKCPIIHIHVDSKNILKLQKMGDPLPLCLPRTSLWYIFLILNYFIFVQIALKCSRLYENYVGNTLQVNGLFRKCQSLLIIAVHGQF